MRGERGILATAVVSSLLASGACRPDLGDRDSFVAAPRIVAMKSEPPEAKAGDVVTYSVLVAAPPGSPDEGVVRWAFCASPKALTENNVVSSECLGAGVRPIAGEARTVMTETPVDACALFGPETPPGNFRPRDADQTGGYFQPVRAVVGAETAFGLLRVRCNLANAPVDIARDFAARYRENRNPALRPLGVTLDGVPRALDRIPAGQRVGLVASWGTGDAESYVAFDVATQSVVDRRESMRVSWFSTGGTFDVDRTGRTETETLATSGNGWLSPERAGPATIWIVLRDSRGGVDFATYAVTVVP